MDLIAAGRDCDVFDAGPGLVLRRARSGRSIEHEARIMRHLHDAGYPVPRIESADGPEIVMERIDGPTLVDYAVRRPFRLKRWAAVLADLHQRLHRIEAPEWLPDSGDGGSSVIHVDLHPLNVIMSPRGPVVIDWANGRRGSEATDVCFTWVIMATSVIEGSLLERKLGPLFRGAFTRAFLSHFDTASLTERLRAVGELRKLDPATRPEEREAVDRLLASVGV